MSAVLEYLRPSTLDEAVGLLARPGAVVLAGGTVVNATTRPAAAVLIDLQALELDSVDVSPTHVRLGAMARLADLADHTGLPTWLRDLARRELPSSLRTLATVGGTVATADWESALVAGLLAADAIVTVRTASGPAEHPLAAVLANRSLLQGAVITDIAIDPHWQASMQSTARTTADRPIVACVAATHPEHGVRTAFTGVATTPVVVDDVDALDPPGDFRGSPGYRLHLVRVLRSRAIAALGA